MCPAAPLLCGDRCLKSQLSHSTRFLKMSLFLLHPLSQPSWRPGLNLGTKKAQHLNFQSGYTMNYFIILDHQSSMSENQDAFHPHQTASKFQQLRSWLCTTELTTLVGVFGVICIPFIFCTKKKKQKQQNTVEKICPNKLCGLFTFLWECVLPSGCKACASP